MLNRPDSIEFGIDLMRFRSDRIGSDFSFECFWEMDFLLH